MPTFGRYEILEKIGEGAMGVVYRARDAALGRVVALKMLSQELGAEEELHQRFMREAEAIGLLNHPNIVTVYDMGEAGGQLYMSMELLEGEDLRYLIEKRVPIPIADRVRILIQICEGVEYAHSKGVVHRDIKPANILVTTSARVKILDFGLARVVTRAAITRRGVILGTPDYMSPEQAMGKPVDRRGDVFSAGSVFYEFLTMEKPFKAKTLHGVLYQIVSEEPDSILTLVPEVPMRLAAVVHRMLAKSADKRYATLGDVRNDLLEIHASLRRSRSHSAGPRPNVASSSDAVRVRVREHVAAGRAHFEAGRLHNAIAEMEAAASLDPECDEALDVLWRAGQRLRGASAERAPAGPDTERRVAALLDQAAPGRPDTEARPALAELALIAPDDPRVTDLVRRRAGLTGRDR
jgi:serine/threonine-protein kinase